FAERFDDGVVVRNVDNLNFFDAQAHNLANGRQGEGLEGTSNRHLAVAHFGGQHFGREFLFIEFLAQLEVLDVVEEFDHFLVGTVTESAENIGGQEFAAAFAADEINVEQVRSVELHFGPGAAVRN